ncbi:hypothetical protein KGD83_20670 [Nocardiopsis akebiae]|uniref:Uncharacterized protein n=1 Tax=Nocardiopsis akebiae TaxID=2831968 RepID=A0ABX8BZV9_9ACTN|nr:hypothetical protein [Nocardiopsis akebiae]QUX27690.1 hypothetical protein KGD83_20670 [Nocardiopsis akebiae]
MSKEAGLEAESASGALYERTAIRRSDLPVEDGPPSRPSRAVVGHDGVPVPW